MTQVHREAKPCKEKAFHRDQRQYAKGGKAEQAMMLAKKNGPEKSASNSSTDDMAQTNAIYCGPPSEPFDGHCRKRAGLRQLIHFETRTRRRRLSNKKQFRKRIPRHDLKRSYTKLKHCTQRDGREAPDNYR